MESHVKWKRKVEGVKKNDRTSTKSDRRESREGNSVCERGRAVNIKRREMEMTK